MTAFAVAPLLMPSLSGAGTISDTELAYVELACRRQGRFVRWYARKRLHQPYREDPAFRSMLMDEARLGALVQHPNAVSVLDVGVDNDGPFLIMDLVDGLPLSRVVGDAVMTGRSIPVQVGVRICLEAAKGLHAGHEVRADDEDVVGLVHRGVCPKSILIGYDGAVQVADFGAATALAMLDPAKRGPSKARSAYRAPELSRFQDADRRADLYSLGVVLDELTTGGNLPSELHELLTEMLAAAPGNRPATGTEVAGRLEAILAALIAEEGLRTVGDHMTRHFAREKEEQRAHLTALLRGGRRFHRRDAYFGTSMSG